MASIINAPPIQIRGQQKPDRTGQVISAVTPFLQMFLQDKLATARQREGIDYTAQVQQEQQARQAGQRAEMAQMMGGRQEGPLPPSGVGPGAPTEDYGVQRELMLQAAMANPNIDNAVVEQLSQQYPGREYQGTTLYKDGESVEPRTPEEEARFRGQGFGQVKPAAEDAPPEIVKLIDARNAMAADDPDRATIEAAINKKVAKRGMRLTVGPDGQMTFTQGEDGARPLTAAQAKLLSEGNQLSLSLDPLETLIDTKGDMFGPVEGRLRAQNPYDTEAKAADAELRRTAQIIGKYMEGGVLRKEDEEKYRKMLPELSDTKAVAKKKMAGVRDLLKNRSKQLVTDYDKAGFDVTEFKEVKPPDTDLPQAATAPEGATGWDTEKREWVYNANR